MNIPLSVRRSAVSCCFSSFQNTARTPHTLFTSLFVFRMHVRWPKRYSYLVSCLGGTVLYARAEAIMRKQNTIFGGCDSCQKNRRVREDNENSFCFAKQIAY